MLRCWGLLWSFPVTCYFPIFPSGNRPTPGIPDEVADPTADIAAGFDSIIGGVEFSGDWYQVWRANVYSRTATRI